MTRLGPVGLTLVVMVFAAGCAMDSQDDPDPMTIDPDGAHYHYVVDSLHFPINTAEALELGANLDNDESNRPDNAFGLVLATLAGVAQFDLDLETRDLIDSGVILHLLDVQSKSLTLANGVGVTLLHADDRDGNPTDNFSGEEVFGIDTAAGQGTMTGIINAGMVHVTLGDVPLAITFPGLEERFIVHLTATQINATITEGGMTGRIGGAITQQELDETVMPFLHAGLARIVDRDCATGACVSGSFGETLADTFDTNNDRALDYDEIANSPLLRSLLAPDMDLLDQNGKLCIRCDGEKDSLSIGVGFTAVPAVIQ